MFDQGKLENMSDDSGRIEDSGGLSASEGHSQHSRWISFEQLLTAAERCSHNVMWKSSTIRWMFNKYVNCASIVRSFTDGTYRLQPYLHIRLEGPKPRDILSTRFVDRVVQRSLCDNYLYDCVTKPLIWDNCACQKGKGLQFAQRRFRKKLRHYVLTHGTHGYVVNLDVRKFFMSVSHDYLKRMLAVRVKDGLAMQYLCDVIDSFKDTRSEGEIRNDTFGQRGVGLGCQISQLLMLLYLHKLDTAMIRRFPTYVRYMDDIVFACDTAQEAAEAITLAERHLQSIGLALNSKSKATRLIQPFSFLKVSYRVLPSGKIRWKMDRRTVSRQLRKMTKLARLLRRGDITTDTVVDQFNSWFGSNEYKMSKSQKRLVNAKFKTCFSWAFAQ